MGEKTIFKNKITTPIYMVKTKYILLGIFIIIILIWVRGVPEEINIFGAKWCIKNCDVEDKLPEVNINIENEEEDKQYLTPIDFLSILDLKPRQKIYSIEDNATVDFTIEDEKEIPYNLNVNWFYNGSRYHGWYNESNETKPFYSWYNTNKKGIWEVQVIISWNYQNESYSKDEITEVKVS